MFLELPKAVKKKVRELLRVVYQRELSKALSKLDEDFEQWRQKRLDALQLSDRIHAFHEGPAQRLYKKWVLPNADMMVAYAVTQGLLSEEEAGPEVVAALDRWIAFFRENELKGAADEAPPDPPRRGG